MVVGDGFEPPNPQGADLQSAAFSLFATQPCIFNYAQRHSAFLFYHRKYLLSTIIFIFLIFFILYLLIRKKKQIYA